MIPINTTTGYPVISLAGDSGVSATLDLALPLIKQFEGCRLSAYRCPAGIPTIGWGKTAGVAMGDTCTQEQADNWLDEEIGAIQRYLATSIPHWTEMLPTHRAALTSFAYNVGRFFYGAEGFETITRVLRERKWAEVPTVLLLYRNPGSSFEEGLKRRRIAEAAMWNNQPVSPKPEPITIKAIRDTYLKKSHLQASALPDDQKKAIRAGQSLRVVWWKESPASRSHIQISLDFEAGNWLVYAPDWTPWATPAPTQSSSTHHHDMSASVSRYFTWGEVWQWDQRRITDDTRILMNIRQHALHLDGLREAWGSPLIVTSWYRDPVTNAAVGGVSNSQHLTGGAADLYPSNGEAQSFEAFCVAHWEFGGIGKGVSSGKGFVHLDSRGQKVVWLY